MSSFNQQLIAHLSRMVDILRAQERKPDVPAIEYDEVEEAESEGLDMNAIGRAAAREVAERPLPRSPEACRRRPF